MSRSCPTETSANPSTRFFEWKGGEGALTYYDKEAKERVFVKGAFRFLVLDVLSTVTGYHDKKGGIYSNEVRNVSTDNLVVKFFKAGEIANGLWSAIKKDVAYEKGQFAASVYIAFREAGKEGPLQIGNIKMSGCALSPWFDFRKAHRKDIETDKAVVIKAGTEITTGSGRNTITFIPPVFSLVDATPETNAEAVALDKELQAFLKGHLKRSVDETLDQRTGHAEEEADQRHPAEDEPPEYVEEVARRAPRPSDPDLDAAEEDDIPF